MILTFTFVTSLWNRSACYRMPLGLPKTEKPAGRVPTSPSSLPLITDLFSPVPRHLLLLCFYMSAYAFMTWLAKMDGQACKCPPTSCFYRMKRKMRQRSFLGRTSANGQEPCEQVPTDERQESEAGTRPDGVWTFARPGDVKWRRLLPLGSIGGGRSNLCYIPKKMTVYHTSAYEKTNLWQGIESSRPKQREKKTKQVAAAIYVSAIPTSRL